MSMYACHVRKLTAQLTNSALMAALFNEDAAQSGRFTPRVRVLLKQVGFGAAGPREWPKQLGFGAAGPRELPKQLGFGAAGPRE
eukprot:1719359-Rhodomonas_salina.3